MTHSRELLIGAHEMGHVAVSDDVVGIMAADGGWRVVCDAPLTESQFVAQMVAGCLAELIITNGLDIALVKLRADKAALCTDIGEFDWMILRQIPHHQVFGSAERIAPIIQSELAQMGGKRLERLGAALLALPEGETLSLEVANA